MGCPSAFDRAFCDHYAARTSVSVDLRDDPVVGRAQGADKRNDIKPELAVRQSPPAFFFRSTNDATATTSGIATEP